MSTSQLRVGLLPLYIELYDRSFAEHRPRMDLFQRQIADALKAQGLETLTVPLCRVRAEFAAAIKTFERARVDAVVTLHLAYSPSLESDRVLAATRLPLIVLDTTPTYDFGPRQPAAEIMYNHGIHGVQDMCNLLVRHGKPFAIEAGHWQKSDVLRRVVRHVRAARLAAALRAARVGRIGAPFAGMGDFAVPPDVMRRTIGLTTVPSTTAMLRRLAAAVRPAEIAAEVAANRRQCDARGVTDEALRRTARTSLAVRRWIEREKLTAFTVNFLAVGRASGLPLMPFLEASQAMARGIGYAGEGDVLTAGLVGALASVYPDTTFTEMFCPDWKGQSIFLSHMGEMNVRLAAGRPVLGEMPFPFAAAERPVRAVGRLRGGRAAFVNLAPLPEQCYRLIVAPVEMLNVKGPDRMSGSVHGWMRPRMKIAAFLAEYSRLAGTHHAALVYGDCAEELMAFGAWMGWETVPLA